MLKYINTICSIEVANDTKQDKLIFKKQKTEAENSNTNSETTLPTHERSRNQRAIRSKSKPNSQQAEIDLTTTINEMGNIDKDKIEPKERQ
jgi:hypothetical protein